MKCCLEIKSNLSLQGRILMSFCYKYRWWFAYQSLPILEYELSGLVLAACGRETCKGALILRAEGTKI